MKRFVFFLVIFILFQTACQTAHGYEPVPGSEDVPRFFSANLLARRINSTGSFDGLGSYYYNPALIGLIPRPVVDFNYTGIIGFNQEEANQGFKGHSGHIGFGLQTGIGAIASSLSFISLPFNYLYYGDFLNLHFAYAYSLLENLHLGIGAELSLGAAEYFDIGVGLDLGILGEEYLPSIGARFRWAAGFLHIGKAFSPQYAFSGYPSAFSPVIGSSLLFGTAEAVSIEFAADFLFPSFQNLVFSLSSGLNILDFLSIQAAWSIDMQEVLYKSSFERSYLPSLGISFVFPLSNGEMKDREKTKLRINSSVSPSYGNIWAFALGSRLYFAIDEPMTASISINADGPVFFSPNGDGSKDSISLPVKLQSIEQVQKLEVRILDDAENTVFIEQYTDTIPATIHWDGSVKADKSDRDDPGLNIVAEGEYQLLAEIFDGAGRIKQSNPVEIVVDNTAPVLTMEEVSGARRIFSPDGDGRNDSIAFEINGTSEQSWVLEIVKNEDSPVFSITREEKKPPAFIWDGKDTNGKVVENGVYHLEVTARDKAGNRLEKELTEIVVNSIPPSMSVSLSHSAISPNRDGKNDVLGIEAEVTREKGIKEWKVSILTDSNREVRRLVGFESIAEEILFDGKGENGQVLPEAMYSVNMVLWYNDGTKIEAENRAFTIDLSPPSGEVLSEYTVFSPDGDGRKDKIRFFQELSREEHWEARVEDTDGKIIRRYSWEEELVGTNDWDGRNDKGSLAPDGLYYYYCISEDKAGNIGRTNSVQFRKDNSQAEIVLSRNLNAFSPNADARRDELSFFTEIQDREEVKDFHFRIKDGEGRVVFTREGESINSKFSWDGKNNVGIIVADGQYKAELELEYKNGNIASAESKSFLLDTEAPRADIVIDEFILSPDGDGMKDAIFLRQSSSKEELWQSYITDESAQKLRYFDWDKELTNFVWDGRDDRGNVLPYGRYYYVVQSEDRAGNRTREKFGPILLDARPVSLFISLSTLAFSPNNDGFKDRQIFSLYTNLTTDIDSWKLIIYNDQDRQIQEFSGKELLIPQIVNWDGRGTNGEITEGSYRAEYRISYRKGNRPQTFSDDFLLDISPPKLDLSYSVLVPDKSEDDVHFSVDFSPQISDQSEIKMWKLEILNEQGLAIRIFAGRGDAPESILWDGKDSIGQQLDRDVSYSYLFTAVDSQNISSEIKGSLEL